jgi:hypothetical protein
MEKMEQKRWLAGIDTGNRAFWRYEGKTWSIFSLFLFLALPLYLSGCGRTEEDIAAEEVSSLQQEIPVDFPFYESENFTLTLVSPGDAAGEYALMLYGEIPQFMHGCMGRAQRETMPGRTEVHGTQQSMKIVRRFWKAAVIPGRNPPTSITIYSGSFNWNYIWTRRRSNAMELPIGTV